METFISKAQKKIETLKRREAANFYELSLEVTESANDRNLERVKRIVNDIETIRVQIATLKDVLCELGNN